MHGIFKDKIRTGSALALTNDLIVLTLAIISLSHSLSSKKVIHWDEFLGMPQFCDV